MKQLNWYQIFGQTHTIPDGRTVTPTDDIQIWLNCADIWDKTYTTLVEVLADTTTLLALINSPNAVDYMVRSTTWAVAQALVPTMTSYTTPSGTASASSEWSNDKAWKAFDGVNSGDNRWSCSGSGSQYLQYVFDSPIVADYIEYSIDTHSAYSTNITFSGDGSTLATIAKPTSSGTLIKQKLSVVEAHTTFRWAYTSTGICGVRELQFYSPSITDNSTAMSYIGLNNYCTNTLLADSTWKTAICQSEYKTSVLNVKVPAMTSDTTPSGSCVASRVATGSSAHLAFDGNDSTYWQSGGSGTGLKNISYTFPSAVTVICMDLLITTGNHLKDFSITNENSEILLTATSPNNSTKQTYILTNPANSRKYQLNCTSDNYSGNQYTDINTLQFYGREDV